VSANCIASTTRTIRSRIIDVSEPVKDKGRGHQDLRSPREEAISLNEFDEAVRSFLRALQIAGVALPTDAIDVINLFKKK